MNVFHPSIGKVAALATASIVVLATACGTATDQVTAEQAAAPVAAEAAPAGAVTASPTREAVEHWIGLLASAPVNEIYDRDYPATLERLVGASDFHVLGRIASVERGEPQALNLAPDPAPESLPYEPDVVTSGVVVTLEGASVVGADPSQIGLANGTLRINVAVFAGPRSSTVADELIETIVSSAPVGASVIGYGKHAGVKDLGLNLGPYGLFVAAAASDPALPADNGLAKAVGERRYEQLVADSAGLRNG